MINILALDKSMRNVDADGRLHIAKTHVSKSAVNPYYGNEIPGWDSLGLQGDKIYQLFRDPDELAKAAPTFARLPILSKHVPVTSDEMPNDLIVGSIGSDVEFNDPYLDADICIWTAEAIAGIESEQVKELSCAYRYVPVMESGESEGVAYDGRMTEIQGNHLALVEAGRAGSDVVVADHNPFPKKENAMKKNRKIEAKKTLLALDADIPPEKLDKIIDALIGVEDEPDAIEPKAAVDEGPAEKIKALLAGKVEDSVIEQIVAMCAPPAADEFPPKKEDEPKEKGMKKEEVKAAMDAQAKGLREEFRALELAKADVNPVVGDVLGMDSACEVYGFALDHLKVDRKGVEGIPALRALYKVASKVQAEVPVLMAHDSAGVTEKFPGANRFRTV
jgi:hypothetical protein